MAREDYYSILGVGASATKDEIRSAHRRLARELHPDINKAPDAAQRFAKVQEAYDVLSDDDKRAVYDRVGHEGYVASGGAGGAPGGAGGWPGGGRGPGRQTYTWTNVGGAPSSDPFNAQDIGDIFEEMFGVRPDTPRGRARPGARRGPGARTEPPDDTEQDVTIPFDLMLTGGKWDVTTPSGETIEVTIPKGVRDGARLRLRGKGERSRAGGVGDLLLRIRVAAHPRYERQGDDIHATLPLSIVEATLGAKVSVETPGSSDGRVELTIPPGTPSGAKLRLRGRGVETKAGKGDFYAIVKIVPPKELSEKDRAMLRDLGERIGHPERE
jgi:DnaJ-class molecular chaperone